MATSNLRGSRRDPPRRRRAYLDYAELCAERGTPGPTGIDWPRHHPEFVRDWPVDRPSWWRPPPGLAEEIAPVLTTIPYGYVEPDWRQWVPPYVPGQRWPWREAA